MKKLIYIDIASGTHEETQAVLSAAPYLINFVRGNNYV